MSYMSTKKQNYIITKKKQFHRNVFLSFISMYSLAFCCLATKQNAEIMEFSHKSRKYCCIIFRNENVCTCKLFYYSRLNLFLYITSHGAFCAKNLIFLRFYRKLQNDDFAKFSSTLYILSPAFFDRIISRPYCVFQKSENKL